MYSEHQIKPNGELKSSFFIGDGLSCDASILTTKEKSRRGMGNPPRWPETSGLVEFTCDAIKTACGQGTYHHPMHDNQEMNFAHSQFYKKLTRAEAKQLIKTAQVIIKPQVENGENNNKDSARE